MGHAGTSIAIVCLGVSLPKIQIVKNLKRIISDLPKFAPQKRSVEGVSFYEMIKRKRAQ